MQVPSPRPTINRLIPYVPGKSTAAVQAELGLTDVLKLASNENPLGPSPLAIEALQKACSDVHIYPDGGASELRTSLAGFWGVEKEQVFATNGSDEAIKLLGEAFLEPSDEVVFADATFSEYAYATRLMGAKEKVVPLRKGKHDLAAMLDAITSQTKLVFVCNPNNPTGTYVTHAELVEFVQQVPAGVLVVVDEAYIEYADAPDFPDVLALMRAGFPVASLRTFSKIYGLAGLRVGYCIAPQEVIAQLNRIKEPFNVNAMAQIAAVAALGDVDHVKASQAMNVAGKQQLYRGFSSLGLSFFPSQANFVLVDVGTPGRPVYEGLLREGVIVRAGESFGLPQALRITVGTEQQNSRVLQALGQVLR